MSRIFLPKSDASCLLCSSCKGYLSVEPVTMSNDDFFCGRCPPGSYRATKYEKLAKFMIFPCINEEYGCTLHLPWNSAIFHEEKCTFKPLQCPISDCKSKMAKEYVRRHIKRTHSDLITYCKKLTVKIDKYFENAERICFWKNTILLVKLFTLDEKDVVHFDISSFDEPNNDLYYSFSVSRNRDRLLDESKFYRIFKHNKFDTSRSQIIEFPNAIKEQLSVAFKIKDCGPTSMTALNDSIIAEIECPICLSHIRPPIYMCESSHNICSSCFFAVQECPLCNSPLRQMRNLALENISNNLTYPCINKISGCEFQEKIPKLKAHEAFCMAGGTRLSVILETSEDVHTVEEVKGNAMNNILNVGQPITLNISQLNKLHLLSTYNGEIFKIGFHYKRGKGLQIVAKKISNITESCYTFYVRIAEGLDTLEMTKECDNSNISDERFTNCLVISDSFVDTVMVNNNITVVLFILQNN